MARTLDPMFSKRSDWLDRYQLHRFVNSLENRELLVTKDCVYRIYYDRKVRGGYVIERIFSTVEFDRACKAIGQAMNSIVDNFVNSCTFWHK